MKLNRIFAINMMIVIGMLALSIWAWRQLPAGGQVPVHFNLHGVPDGYMGKIGGLLLLPLLTVLITLVSLIIPKIEPHQENIRRSGKAYAASIVGGAVMMGSVHSVIVLTALGKSVDVNAVVSTAMGCLFIILGNYFSKIRRNYSLGLRTPWTLSSDLAWHKTHRLASWVLILHGVSFLVAGLLSSATLMQYSVMSLLVFSLVVLPVYSYLLWKSDTNRSIN